MFEKIPTSSQKKPEQPEQPEKKNAKEALKKIFVGGMATGMVALSAEQALAARDTTTEFQDRKSTEHKVQTSSEKRARKDIENKLGGRLVLAKAEKQEQMHLFVSGTIGGREKFEIYKTNFNPEDDQEFIRSKKNALEAYNKSSSMEDLKKYRILDKEARNKAFKIFINGKEVHITDTELYMDSGSRGFKTDMGNFFIAHPRATELDIRKNDYKKKESRFSTPDGKEHLIQAQWR